ncbi:MAG TPA: signal peptidase I [Acholeplasma sp.]|jgi:signal peptidase I|nr:signal peptidase I [Acholeplasma sp.]
MNFTNKEIEYDFSVSSEDRTSATTNKKKVIKKLKIAFFLLLALLLLTYYFLVTGGGRFSSFYTKVIFTGILLVAFLLTFVVLYIHLNADVKLKHFLNYFKFYDIIQFLLLTIFIIVFLQIFIFKTASISGSSMDPTLKHGDEVFILQWVNKYKNNDIVVIDATRYSSGNQMDLAEKHYYIKRIRGLPGDVLSLKQVNSTNTYEIEINGVSLKNVDGEAITVKEESVHYQNLERMAGKIPEGFYFLLGDGTNSRDSKSFGFVDGDDILGTVNFRVWKKFGVVR